MAKIFSELIGDFECMPNYVKTAVDTFGQLWEKLGYFLFKHLVPLFETLSWPCARTKRERECEWVCAWTSIVEGATSLLTKWPPHPVWPDVGMKSCQIVSKSCQKVAKSSFYIKRFSLKIAQTCIKCLGNFCMMIFCQEFSKIAQFGHTVPI